MLTKSQITSAIATAATIIVALSTQLVPYAHLLPTWMANALPVAGIIAGVVITARSQSLNMNHVSIPVEKAKELGVALDQTKGK